MIQNIPKTILRAACLSGLCAAFSVASLSGQVVTTANDGAWIRNDSTAQSGGTDILATGTLNNSTTLRSLVTFNLPAAGSSAIPSNAGVWFYMDRDDIDDLPGLQTINLHLLAQDVERVVVDNNNQWPNWLEYSAGNAWNTPGGDFDPTPLASVEIDMNTAGAGTTFTFQSSALTQALQTAADGSGTISFALDMPGLNQAAYDQRAIVWVQGQTGSNPPTIIPEPSTYAAIFGGLALLGMLLRRRMRK
ncbi:MAG: PEP-CTERM sorting domain-containing protein [Opitutales bacterium]|nr:PEP-CTERM sorting domain-containing protein [Opitutales bacterium]